MEPEIRENDDNWLLLLYTSKNYHCVSNWFQYSITTTVSVGWFKLDKITHETETQY